jgi:two-component system phosphate regulon sensor histidine kinase PhoR
MRKTKLRLLLFGAFLLIILGLMTAFLWIAVRTFTHFYYTETAHHLETKARLIAQDLNNGVPLRRSPRLQALCRDLSSAAAVRITFIQPDGRVLADSEEFPEHMDNHADRTEVQGALAGRLSTSERYSHTLRQNMLYVALPYPGMPPQIIIRVAIPTTSMSHSLSNLYIRFALFSGLVILCGAGLGLWLAQKISRPWEEMRRHASRFAQGELNQKLETSELDEANGLAESLNQMASQLDDRTQALLQKQQEQEAILASMAEGVVAVDREERILNLNQAARVYLNITAPRVLGRPLAEVVRNSQLQQLLAHTLTGTISVEGDIVISGNSERFLQVHGSILRDAQAQNIGAVLVLNDLTRIRRLETLRREFVANVSHELKTPITLIQGFAETLEDGALKKADEAKHFLQIIAKQTERLHTIIEDLLTLSRIEQESERGSIPLAPGLIQPVLLAALSMCRPVAEVKKIKLELSCPEQLQARINDRLLEQAVVNYLNNAVAYSEVRTTVTLTAESTDTGILISVRDQGIGIAAEHLPRLFERFYRVDKGRSREAGGSGLGLAIVKHIVQAHDGKISVESEPGKGSTFSIHLPKINQFPLPSLNYNLTCALYFPNPIILSFQCFPAQHHAVVQP